MSHVVDAVYENGVLKLEHPLPLKNQEKVRVTVESFTAAAHRVVDIPPVSVGKILRPLTSDDDLLGEMLQYH